MTIQEISQKLLKFSQLLALENENRFKISAYQQASQTVLDDQKLVLNAKNVNDLQVIKGVGKGISHDVWEMLSTHRFKALDLLSEKYPPTIFELFEIKGLGASKIKILYEQLGVASLGELEYACHENRLVALPKFKEKTQSDILKKIHFINQNKGLFLLDEVESVAKLIEEFLKSIACSHHEFLGAFKRKALLMDKIELTCKVSSPLDLKRSIQKKFELIKYEKEKIHARVMNVNVIFYVDQQLDPIQRFYFNSSMAHVKEVQAFAKTKGIDLSEAGLIREGRNVSIANENDIYRAIGLDWIDPVQREGQNDIQAHAQCVKEWLNVEDVKGILHAHTDQSDGQNTIEEMVQKAKSLGHQFIGISDHSKSAFYANGLSEKEIDQQHREIDRVQKKHPNFKIFKGIESDILADGSLDYPDKILKKFDFVIASIHSRMKMNRDQMTQRCLNALSNPMTKMLGHPTGRLLLGRPSFEIDVKEILRCALKHHKIIEINSNPRRLDLDWQEFRKNNEFQVMVAINSDAHDVDAIEDYRFGVYVAQKAGIPRGRVINTMDVKSIEKWFKQ